MKQPRFHVVGLIVTLSVHLGVFGAVWGMNALDKKRIEDRARLSDQVVVIEAGLAFKKKERRGRRSRLPQKEQAPKVKPQDVSVTRDATAKPETRDKKERAPADKLDPESVFDKYRNVETVGDSANVGSGGGDDVDQEGSDLGSEWGTLDQAKGDPYVGELVGRMTQNPPITVPSVVPRGEGLETYGCVRLAPDGSIVGRVVPDEHKSANRVFNRAVEERLKITTDMDRPVPAHLKELLIEKGICVPYRY